MKLIIVKNYLWGYDFRVVSKNYGVRASGACCSFHFSIIRGIYEYLSAIIEIRKSIKQSTKNGSNLDHQMMLNFKKESRK